jgi:hypothetical protein
MMIGENTTNGFCCSWEYLGTEIPTFEYFCCISSTAPCSVTDNAEICPGFYQKIRDISQVQMIMVYVLIPVLAVLCLFVFCHKRYVLWRRGATHSYNSI